MRWEGLSHSQSGVRPTAGRLDAVSSSESVESTDGRLPEGEKGGTHLKSIFRPKGLNDKEIVRDEQGWVG